MRLAGQLSTPKTLTSPSFRDLLKEWRHPVLSSIRVTNLRVHRGRVNSLIHRTQYGFKTLLKHLNKMKLLNRKDKRYNF